MIKTTLCYENQQHRSIEFNCQKVQCHPASILQSVNGMEYLWMLEVNGDIKSVSHYCMYIASRVSLLNCI